MIGCELTGVRSHSWSSLDYAVVLPYVTVNRNARLTNCVIDRGVIIPEGLVVGEDPLEDAKWFHVSDGGVTLITARSACGSAATTSASAQRPSLKVTTTLVAPSTT